MKYTENIVFIQLHFQKTVLLVLAAKHFTAECKISRLQSYGQPLGTQNRRTEAYTRGLFCTEPYTDGSILQPQKTMLVKSVKIFAAGRTHCTIR